MQEEWMAQNSVNTKAVQDLIKRVDEMLRRMDEHDRFTREAIIAMRERTNKA
jgi:chemotaxis regulatin CheY-phosphate phosphatase CheZ